MRLRRLSATRAAAARYVAELWLPYHRDLAERVDGHALADRPEGELIAEETDFRLDRLREDDYRLWVVSVAAAGGSDEPVDAAALDSEGPGALDPAAPAAPGVPGPDRDLVAFVSTGVDACPVVFDRPDRLVVGDLYVSAAFRGTGLADRLMERAAIDARERDCEELRLDVDADNERALAFYEKQGFEAYRERLTRPVE
ncbi:MULTISPECIES: N-acetyltransferase [unclassified Halorubrum]|uniref:GNAT family N-acetyltransferase n=1 Tax=unclassified Halorubrum TaxID=2642239 RepID=UPI000B9932F0|nr:MULTISPECIES: GNAT family N-acetyltransferase [unclassified Halorubrum]OYR40013.1 GNAT family N-acetyltransferase [Halorubrum sp. Hd13]OYR42675.1 GNAT family N-acetyltransferase [Halorubrum sp. Eb13]OYR50622.1 GNAT family N-acetyltransferase [Halorubrum sp. Ea8]OYR52427.1 GNAT family N-acetyltransferase [Halorubrum sp. Ea1]